MSDVLAQLAATAWPAREQVELGGWLLRASAGVTMRANSALPLTDSPAPLDDLLGAVEDFYDARLLPPRVQVTDLGLDAELDARGWTASHDTDLLVGPLPDVAGSAVVGELDVDWLDAWWALDSRGGGAAEREVATSMLGLVQHPVGYAQVRREGAVVGVARGVAQGPWLGVFQVGVLPAHRRGGLGRELLSALWAWGEEQGTTTAYLQVGRDNPGRGLYAGMQVAGSYRYRTRPAPSR
ncbi:MAG: GCN5-related N-acetyltransferase [Frankiales bacterium]|nr:GCN5-related N-acetyltransferase [Frankiales bacterium]